MPKATPTEIIEQLLTENEDAVQAEGFESCLVGICYQFGRLPIACYDYDACIRLLVERDKMTHDGAIEFFDFNVIGASVGPSTPAFVNLFT